MYIRQLFSGLVEDGPENTVLPDVAQDWEILQNGTQYLFHLREDARWSDGTPVSSTDFEYSWKRALTMDESNVPAYFYDIKGAKEFHQGDSTDPDQIGIRTPGEKSILI
jgi:oligopeptide transport system substrate-binding protein